MRDLPDPGFAGDDGAADPVLAEALVDYDRAAGQGQAEAATRASQEVLARLQDTRLLVPVVAVVTEFEDTNTGPGADDAASGLPREKTSDMAAVLMTGRDGRTALLAFTGTAAMDRWDPAARPVPVPARQAARAAIQDEASALLLDVAGPAMFVVQGEDLTSLAAGHRLTRLDADRWAWVTTPVPPPS